jgi:hypothetical protein
MILHSTAYDLVEKGEGAKQVFLSEKRHVVQTLQERRS